MVRVTGPSLETLYAYLNEQVGTRAPASHNHAQSEVTGLASALDGKAPATHNHAQSQITGLEAALAGSAQKSTVLTDGSDLNEVVTSGFYRLGANHKNAWPGANYSQMIVSRSSGTTVLQIGSVYESGAVYTRTASGIGSPTSAPTWTAWKRLYREGDGIAAYEQTVQLTVPKTGWSYESSYDRYRQVFSASGVKSGDNMYVYTYVGGANCPLIGVGSYADGQITVFMADIPTISDVVYIRVFRFN